MIENIPRRIQGLRQEELTRSIGMFYKLKIKSNLNLSFFNFFLLLPQQFIFFILLKKILIEPVRSVLDVNDTSCLIITGTGHKPEEN